MTYLIYFFELDIFTSNFWKHYQTLLLRTTLSILVAFGDITGISLVFHFVGSYLFHDMNELRYDKMMFIFVFYHILLFHSTFKKHLWMLYIWMFGCLFMLWMHEFISVMLAY